MKYPRQRFPTYWWLRRKYPHRLTWFSRLRKIAIVLFFLVSTVSSSYFFFIIDGNAYVMAPRNPHSKDLTASVSNALKIDASTQKTNLNTVTSSNTQSESSTSGSIPAKLSWTNMSLFVNPNNSASQYASANPSLPDVQYIARMGQVPVAQWFGDWDSNVTESINTYVSSATATGTIPVVALYNIPNRDCGGYSATGAPSVSAYIQWIKQAAAGIGGRSAVVILEPDALAGADCLSSDGQSQRYQAIAQAVTIIKALPHASVYIDAGNPTWQSATTISQRLEAANIAQADGFSLNISYFTSTAQNISYGDQISKLVGNKHYVIDTSRSGGNHNVSGAQFNPSFASLGDLPTTKIDNARIDALLWIKIPWESDGPVNGGPSPGTPYWSYAIQLAKNAGW